MSFQKINHSVGFNKTKAYSFKYGASEQKSAIKGFTLNYENDNLLNHESFKQNRIETNKRNNDRK